jgi:thioredoxin reductase (NADPH)
MMAAAARCGSRARTIARASRWHPGSELLDRLRRQAERYGALLRQKRIEALERDEDGSFVLTCGPETITAKSALLATGADDVQAPVPDLDDAVRRGVVRHCPT